MVSCWHYTSPYFEKPMSALNAWLEGVRVLDLSQYLPGPLATLFLADFGADVLKIEPPRGDEMRNLGPRDDNGRPIFYEAVNAGKVVAIRHPVNDYRLFKQVDLDSLLKQVASASKNTPNR